MLTCILKFQCFVLFEPQVYASFVKPTSKNGPNGFCTCIDCLYYQLISLRLVIYKNIYILYMCHRLTAKSSFLRNAMLIGVSFAICNRPDIFHAYFKSMQLQAYWKIANCFPTNLIFFRLIAVSLCSFKLTRKLIKTTLLLFYIYSTLKIKISIQCACMTEISEKIYNCIVQPSLTIQMSMKSDYEAYCYYF